jgi:hypothetical protein
MVNGVSERLFRTGLTLPSGSALTAQECAMIDDTLRSALRALGDRALAAPLTEAAT